MTVSPFPLFPSLALHLFPFSFQAKGTFSPYFHLKVFPTETFRAFLQGYPHFQTSLLHSAYWERFLIGYNGLKRFEAPGPFEMTTSGTKMQIDQIWNPADAQNAPENSCLTPKGGSRG